MTKLILKFNQLFINLDYFQKIYYTNPITNVHDLRQLDTDRIDIKVYKTEVVRSLIDEEECKY